MNPSIEQQFQARLQGIFSRDDSEAAEFQGWYIEQFLETLKEISVYRLLVGTEIFLGSNDDGLPILVINYLQCPVELAVKSNLWVLDTIAYLWHEFTLKTTGQGLTELTVMGSDARIKAKLKIHGNGLHSVKVSRIVLNET